MNVIKERARSIKELINRIEKQFGEGAIMQLSAERKGPNVSVIPSGSINLDRALGVGGFPKGRLVEIFGPESSGKTTLALQAIAEAQKANQTCAFIDAEHALDITYAQALGVSVSELLVAQPDHGEQALELADHLVRSGSVGLIVIDSVAALVPKVELDGEVGDCHVGLQARMMSQAMRKLTGGTHRQGTTIIFINQTRQKIGVMYGSKCDDNRWHGSQILR